MKAIISTKYGKPEVLQVKEIEKPTPKDNEIRIKIHAASVTAADSMMRKGTPYFGRLIIGLRKPKKAIPGTGFAGEVEMIGKSVKQFKKGDQIFGETILNLGAHAEFVCVEEDGVIAKLPLKMTYEEAAPVCDGALTSLNFLKDLAQIKPGQKVLINGAAGSLGTAAIQLAKSFGAEVTGVCRTVNKEMVKSIGADHVIDYTKEDFASNKKSYDIIYDTVGKSSFSKCKRALKTNGVYVSPVLNMTLLFQMMATSIFGKKKAKFSATGIRKVPELKTLLTELINLIELGKLKSVIDRSYPLEQIAKAHTYIDKGHKKGNVVVTMNHKF